MMLTVSTLIYICSIYKYKGIINTTTKHYNMNLYISADAKIELEKFEANMNQEIEENHFPIKYPLFISASLDCSIRIWSINFGKCIKQFYVYNPVNYFDFCDTLFLIALGTFCLKLD
jgi:WD40 repeat protein